MVTLAIMIAHTAVVPTITAIIVRNDNIPMVQAKQKHQNRHSFHRHQCNDFFRSHHHDNNNKHNIKVDTAKFKRHHMVHSNHKQPVSSRLKLSLNQHPLFVCHFLLTRFNSTISIFSSSTLCWSTTTNQHSTSF